MKKQFLSTATMLSLLFVTLCNHVGAQTQSFPANKTYGYGSLPSNKNSQDAVSNYNTWKTNFVEACSNGRFRVKFDDRSQTVSEGIAYGMLLSAYAGDRTLFDGLWNYYKDNRNSNGVMNWKINGCSGAIGYNGATDSEVDAAMALIVADYQWGTSGAINYKNDAKALISAIKNFEVEAGSYVLKPGDQFGGSNLTNASYFAPGYFRTFATYMNDNFWNNVADKAYVVINNNLSVNNAAGGLVSDWSTASGSYSSAAGGYANGGRNYSYDAARTPWRIAVDYVWYGNASAKAYSKKSSDFVRVNLGGSQNVKDGYSQNGSAISNYHNSTFVGAFASAAMGGENQSHLDNSYSDLKNINDAGSYFNQTLKTLYLFLLTGNFYLPGAGPVVPPVVVVQAPYGSAPAAIPGKIEAEKYDLGGTLAYNDATVGNDGSAFRSDDVDIEATTDAGGGYNIGYTAAGEWLEYTVNITTAGKYDVAVRVAAATAGKSMYVEMNGVNITGTIAIPNTGGWQVWQTVTVPNITLTTGTKIMKVVMVTDGFNFNYINITASTTTPTNVAPTVSLTAPANNATYTAPASVTVSANAADSDGTISKVEFFNGATLLATDAAAPYSYTWTNVAAGTYAVTAKATDNSGAVTTSGAVSITVNAEPIENPGDCNTEAIPAASLWVVRNSWADQGNGSKVISAPDALNIRHRQWGNPELWAIQTGKSISVVNGQTYTILFDVKNDAQTPVTGIDVGFATGELWNGAILAQAVVSVSGLPATYTTKTVTITSTYTGTVYLAYDLKLSGQPNNEVNVFIKNISVCSDASVAARTFAAPNEVDGVIMGANPFAGQTSVTIPYASTVPLTISISDMNGITVWESSTLQTNTTVPVGAELPIGTYIVSAYFAGTSKVFRLIKY